MAILTVNKFLRQFLKPIFRELLCETPFIISITHKKNKTKISITISKVEFVFVSPGSLNNTQFTLFSMNNINYINPNIGIRNIFTDHDMPHKSIFFTYKVKTFMYPVADLLENIFPVDVAGVIIEYIQMPTHYAYYKNENNEKINLCYIVCPSCVELECDKNVTHVRYSHDNIKCDKLSISTKEHARYYKHKYETGALCQYSNYHINLYAIMNNIGGRIWYV